MKKDLIEPREMSAEELAYRKARRKNIIAFAVCVLIAFFLWLAIMNADNSSGNGGNADDPLPTIFAKVTDTEL